jgi:hypothetical protein
MYRKARIGPAVVLNPTGGPAEEPGMAVLPGYQILTKPEPNHQARLAACPLTS